MRLYNQRNERLDRVLAAVESEDVETPPPKRKVVQKVKEQVEAAEAAEAAVAAPTATTPTVPPATTKTTKATPAPQTTPTPNKPKEPSMSVPLEKIPPGHKLAFVMERVYDMVDEGTLSPEAARRIEWRADQAKQAKARLPAKFDIKNSLKHIGLIAGVGAAATLSENAYNKIQRRRHFNKMIEANPEIKRMDTNQVNVAYNTLHRFAPSVTRDPFAAGSAVKKMVEYETVDPDTIRSYQSIEKDRENGIMSGVFRAVRQAATGM